MPGVGKKLITLADRRRDRAVGVGHMLKHDDPRWDCRMVVELASESFDPDYLGVGSTAWGDPTGLGVLLPTFPTRDFTTRFLVRLVQAQIAPKRAIMIRGIWQYATIRSAPETRAEGDCSTVNVPIELEITSPGWHFQDANISWHLRWEPNHFSAASTFDPAGQIPGTSPQTEGQDTALLYVPPFLPYTPPGAGIPPGSSVDFLGTWREMRYQDMQSRELSIPVIGPGKVTFYASVHQTNVETRCPITIPAGVGRPEDQFVAALEADNDVVYGRVAGGLAVELFPCCNDLLEHIGKNP